MFSDLCTSLLDSALASEIVQSSTELFCLLGWFWNAGVLWQASKWKKDFPVDCPSVNDMEQPKPEPLSENFRKHNSNKYLVKRQSLTRQMILCITMNESLHNASKQDKPLCYRQCEPFFHLTTANIHWTRAQRVCLWGQPRKKSAPAGACYTTTSRITHSVFHTETQHMHSTHAWLSWCVQTSDSWTWSS